MKILQFLMLVVFCLAIVVTPVLAQGTRTGEVGGVAADKGKMYQEGKYAPPNVPVFSGAGLAAGLGMGLTIIGAGLGLGRIGASALESMARQPEVARVSRRR